MFKRMSCVASSLRFVAFGTALLAPGTLFAQQPVASYSGDGLTVVINEMSETTGVISGQLVLGANTFPFTGKMVDDAGGEVVRGTFTAGSEKYDFTTREEAGTDVLLFTTGGKTYRLKPGTSGPVAPEKPVEPLKPPNPLTEDPAKPVAPVAPVTPVTPVAPVAPAPNLPPANAGQLPAVLKLKLHQFPDVTMGVPNAYQILLPEGWTSEGKIEWSPGDLSYPQPLIVITSPDMGRVHMVPALTLMYTEMKPLQGFDTMPPSGVPAPRDLPRWYIDAVKKVPKYSNVQLISSRRDQAAERVSAAAQQGKGMTFEAHVVTLEWDEANVRRRGETSMMYVRHPDYDNQNIHSETWSVFTTALVNGPRDKFESQKAELYQVAAGIIATPQWWTLSQKLLAELSQIRIENRAEAIKRRGQQINQMSDTEYANYKASTKSSEVAQRDRINTIYERDDFRDTDGKIVNLPMHYKNVFSDGRGNYVLSNNTQDKPGEQWTTITPMK